MFDLGLSELLVIGIVALIVVGPKDLPVLFRKVGQFVGKMKGMAREFSKAMNDAADESGMRETAASLRSIADPKKMGLDSINDAVKDAAKWDPESETGKLAAKRDAERRDRMVKEANENAAKTAAEVREAHAKRVAAEAKAEKAAAKTSAAKKPAAKKPAAKTAAKTAAKPAAKAAAKAPASKPAKKPAAKKPAAKKSAAKKTAAKSKST